MASVEPYDPATTDQWPVCTACGTQFPTAVDTCFICDDPRQFVPASGQSFTTVARLKELKYQNVFTRYARDARITYIQTEPAFGIGQRATLVATPAGNVLWDCLTLVDDETIARIRQQGGLKAIVISHPHFYSAHVVWARAFACPVYTAAEDAPWCTMSSAHRQLLTAAETAVLDTGVTAIKMGGHFPGSMVLLFDGHLFVADTFMLTMAGVGDYKTAGGRTDNPPGLNTFTFMWSYPNMIPLGPEALASMWERIRGYEFRAAHGSFAGRDLEDDRVKGRLLESMQLQVRAMGHADHVLLREVL